MKMIDEIENYSDFKTKQQIKSYIKKYGFDKYIELFKEDYSGFCPSALLLDNEKPKNRTELGCLRCEYGGYGDKGEKSEELFIKCHKNFLSANKLMLIKKSNMEGYIR